MEFNIERFSNNPIVVRLHVLKMIASQKTVTCSSSSIREQNSILKKTHNRWLFCERDDENAVINQNGEGSGCETVKCQTHFSVHNLIDVLQPCCIYTYIRMQNIHVSRFLLVLICLVVGIIMYVVKRQRIADVYLMLQQDLQSIIKPTRTKVT